MPKRVKSIRVKRVYEAAANDDGSRVLVDRLWPRGVSKNTARIDLWAKKIAPSAELRKWFGHDPSKWVEFRKRYSRELKKNSDAMAELEKLLRKGPVTLVFSARDEKHNNGVALKEYLESNLGDL
jgi:uncharacterized protein YeaO (DUF488 family)